MRDLNLPPDVIEALAGKPSIRQRFMHLAPSHQREYLSWIEQALRPETRARRIASMMKLLERDG